MSMSRTLEFLPIVLPSGYRKTSSSDDGASYEYRGLRGYHTVIVSAATERQSIQVLPSEAKYINQHPFCLHLFTCLSDSDPIPDFTRGGSTL